MAQQSNNTPKTGKNEEYEIQQANESKQPQSTTITVRVPYNLKARLYDLSEQSKMTLNAYVATRIYKVVQGEYVHRERWEAESNLHNQLAEDKGKVEKKRDDLSSQVTDLNNQVKDMQKRLKPTTKRNPETGEQFSDRIEQLEHELRQYKDKLDDKENARKREASKRQQFEGKVTKANRYLDKLTGGFGQPEKKQV